VRLKSALAAIFFLSGAAALLFETLWFRLSGLVVGNSAWASAIVLAAFMAGLAIGNVLATRFPGRPLRVYAALEIATGVAGLLLVLVLPHLPSLLAPLFRPLLDSPMLNAARLLIAFAMMVVPATMMGATLPTIVSALARHDTNFGRVLGLLYGCNTIGAVVGTLAGELVLIRVLGLRGTAVVAALCSIAAGLAAGRAEARLTYGTDVGRASARPGPRPLRLLLAAGAAGFALLALEVLWFRLVILFVVSTTLTFAVMLAMILVGIGLGALFASAVMSRYPDADRYAGFVAAAIAAALVLSYGGFAPSRNVVVDSARLMLPVSVLSGVLFTLLGRAVGRVTGEETRATATVTFANTVGAALGPLVAGFALIPTIGVERTFFAVGVLYALVAVLLDKRAVVAVLALVFFPFGLMHEELLPAATRQYRDSKAVAVREGRTETAVVLRKDYAGEPYVHRLFTNGFSMSATTFPSQRYMSAFVYLPLAMRPDARNALLISYGVGVTAKRLAEVPQLMSIDVVDISRDILDLGAIVWPGGENPLADPRMRVHVEDGRFFLLTTPQRFDLITGEPPPPKAAGVVNLYTREYFQLVRGRLTDNGVASYWLPVYQMTDAENKAIIRAFCDAFDDCSLWSGAGLEWILIGGTSPLRRAPLPPSAARLGFETTEHLAATFIADAATLRRITADTPPLTDDFPLRLGTDTRQIPPPMATALMQRLPRWQQVTDGLLFAQRTPPPPSIALLRSVLDTTDSRLLPRLLFGSDPRLEEIARARGIPAVLAVGALADRRYAEARELFTQAGMKEYADLAAAYTSANDGDRSLLPRGNAHPQLPLQQRGGAAPQARDQGVR
jgi:spermidine synthase